LAQAYTTFPQHVRGYCALPLLWREPGHRLGHLAVRDTRLQAQLGYTTGRAPLDAGFPAALPDEEVRMAVFQAPDDT
jgi:hypothetical protein